MTRWDILVVTIPHRHERLCALLASLDAQMRPGVRVLVYRDNLQATVGAKRQALLRASRPGRAGYVSFVDDDDRVAPDYVPRIAAALAGSPDYVGFPVVLRTIPEAAVRMVLEMSGPRHHDLNSFWAPPGQVMAVSAEEAAGLVARGWAVPAAVDDIPGVTIEHSLRHAGWQDGRRDISHLNPVRRDLAMLGTFAGEFAEDYTWASHLRASGRVRTETWIPDPMYYYDYRLSDCSETSREPMQTVPPLPSYPWLRVVSDDHVGCADLLDPAPA